MAFDKRAAALGAMRGSFASFFAADPPNAPYVYGRHTRAVIAACDQLVRDVEAGRPRYLIINMMFRSGKSDISSRMLPAWFLIRNPDHEVMLASYGATLSEGFARDARAKFTQWGAHYGLSVDKGSRAVDNWRIAGRRGGMRSIGLQGGAVGHGFKLGIVDDFYKSRLEAESPVIRNRVREGFQADFLTRRAPVSGIIVLAHRQHPDDLCAWLINSATPGHELYDPRFPKFDVLKFPAQSPDYVSESNPGGWMFPERWSADYYESQRAGMSPYLWSALAMQDPQPRTGNVFTLANVAEWGDKDGPPDGLRWAWGWDLASTEEQRLGLKSGDPDYTSGVLAAWEPGKSATDAGTIWIRRVVRGRWAAAERERQQVAEARRNKAISKTLYIEVVAGYKDAYTRLRDILQPEGFTVIPITPTTDKLTRAERCEAVFTNGRVRLAPGEAWQDRFLDEVGSFPSAPHDDQVDAMVLALDDALTKRKGERIFEAAEGDRLLVKFDSRIVPEFDPNEPETVETSLYYALSDPRLLEEHWRRGKIYRAWSLSQYKPSAAVWVHIDRRGNWTLLNGFKAKGTLDELELAAYLRSRDYNGAPLRLSRDVLTSVDDEAFGVMASRTMGRKARERAKALGRVPRGGYLNWVAPEELDGKAGLEPLHALLENAGRSAEPMMVYHAAAREVMEELRAARLKPVTGDDWGDDAAGVKEELAGGGGPYLRALRALALNLA